jgi:hypothetical protein
LHERRLALFENRATFTTPLASVAGSPPDPLPGTGSRETPPSPAADDPEPDRETESSSPGWLRPLSLGVLFTLFAGGLVLILRRPRSG